MKIYPLALLTTFNLYFCVAVSAEDTESTWTRATAVIEAEAWLSQDEFSIEQLKQAVKWLDHVDAYELDLKQDAYLKVLAYLSQNKKMEATDELIALMTRFQGLSDRACRFRSPFNTLLPKAFEKALRTKKYEEAAALIEPLIDLGTDEILTRYTRVTDILSSHRKPEAASVRTALAAEASGDSRLTPLEIDYVIASIHGNHQDLKPPVREEQMALDFDQGYRFDQPDFLIVGGGGKPSANQVSLEKNVEFFIRLQQDLGLVTNRNHILFADGSDASPDLQLKDPEDEAPELHHLLAYLLGSTSGLDYRYRSNRIKHTKGTSSRENIQKYFDQLKLEEGQQLLVNFTGHGGRGDKNNNLNTSLYLWPDKTLRMQEFCAMLDKVPKDVPVVLLMVQCYSGGFARTIFKDGDPKKGLSEHLRCGFFSTVYSRPAAGCTPDINEENYREYSSYFLAALGGKDRLGDPIDKPDYNHDGEVSFAEAHAYALIASDTIDISVKTTDIFLREFSHTRSRADEWNNRLLDVGEFGDLLDAAGPSERAVLDGLAEKLNLCGDGCVITAIRRSRAIGLERDELKQDLKKQKEDIGKLKKEVADYVKKEWPELRNPWHPRVGIILNDATTSSETLYFIKKHHKFKKLKAMREAFNALDDRENALERDWVKYQRFIRTAEQVAMEANLLQTADEDLLKAYRKLQHLENGTLSAPQKDAPAPEEEL